MVDPTTVWGHSPVGPLWSSYTGLYSQGHTWRQQLPSHQNALKGPEAAPTLPSHQTSLPPATRSELSLKWRGGLI